MFFIQSCQHNNIISNEFHNYYGNTKYNHFIYRLFKKDQLQCFFFMNQIGNKHLILKQNHKIMVNLKSKSHIFSTKTTILSSAGSWNEMKLRTNLYMSHKLFNSVVFPVKYSYYNKFTSVLNINMNFCWWSFGIRFGYAFSTTNNQLKSSWISLPNIQKLLLKEDKIDFTKTSIKMATNYADLHAIIITDLYYYVQRATIQSVFKNTHRLKYLYKASKKSRLVLMALYLQLLVQNKQLYHLNFKFNFNLKINQIFGRQNQFILQSKL